MPRAFEKPCGDSHAGLCYEAAAPVGMSDGRAEDSLKSEWLDAIAEIHLPDGYAAWFKQRWRKTMEQECYVAECVATSPLLVGSGNASGCDVGLHLHHTWGVPVVPGSAVKGMLSHYLDAVYGPDPEHDEVPPASAEHPTPERARFRRGSRKLAIPPGDWQRILFGSADFKEASASAGHVVFHDMLPVPPDDSTSRSAMLARDVLTPHHGDYYQKNSAANDYEDPTPVPFLSVPPQSRYLLAVGGQRAWAEFAIQQLAAAVSEWGLGGKTAAGYGRMVLRGEINGPRKPAVASAAARNLKTELHDWFVENQPREESLAAWQELVTALRERFQNELTALTEPEERKELVQVIRSAIAKTTLSKREKKTLRDLLDQL